ncbi:MAG: fumarate hydratase [Spirochaetes bacterium]|nr:fumarate hydratase [Spirochaetota bacterium]
MREIHTDTIETAVRDLIYETNHVFPPEAAELFASLRNQESSETAKETMDVLIENCRIAKDREIPLCQDCGMVIVFIEMGQDLHVAGKPLDEAVNDAVRNSYEKFYLRKSIVRDPLRRTNTGTNTPCGLHTEIVRGERMRLTVYLKGGGSENMSALRMFRPTDPPELIIQQITEAVIQAGPNPCPPLFLGIGIGGSADQAMLNSKKALLRGILSEHPDPYYRGLEDQIMQRINRSGIGPLGFGGTFTVARVYIKEAPTHIATLPVAINMNCHSLRFGSRTL